MLTSAQNLSQRWTQGNPKKMIREDPQNAPASCSHAIGITCVNIMCAICTTHIVTPLLRACALKIFASLQPYARKAVFCFFIQSLAIPIVVAS